MSGPPAEGAPGPGQRSDWSWLLARLSGGEDCVKQVNDFLRAGGDPDRILTVCLGNRDLKARPCMKSLRALVEAGADVNVVDERIGSPAIHLAAWHGTPECVSYLLDSGADMEAGEHGKATPPLNTALAAGNAPVALALLERRANVQWKHDDGATALHVATAWFADSGQRSQRRLPPMGAEPKRVIQMLYHNGVDPEQREGFRGVKPFDGFRGGIRSSPWLEDDEIAPMFKATTDGIHALMLAVDEAFKQKQAGNKAFQERRYKAALAAWAEARSHLEKEDVTGHHMAVLWSNTANCSKKIGDFQGGWRACEAGLKHYCTEAVRAKLAHHLADCLSSLGDPSRPGEALAQKAASEPTKDEARAAKAAEAKRIEKGFFEGGTTAVKEGFFEDLKEPMYGPEGSVQGKNLSELVDAHVQGTTVKVPFRKTIPLQVNRDDYYAQSSDSDEDPEDKARRKRLAEEMPPLRLPELPGPAAQSSKNPLGV